MSEPIKRRFKALTLPPEVQQTLERLLGEGHTYDQIHAHMATLGADISRAAVGRWGRYWLAKQQDLDALAHLAQTYAERQEAPLGLEKMAAALALDLICRCLLEHPDIVTDDLSIRDVSTLVGAIGRLQSSGVQREKYQSDVTARARAAAEDVARRASREGLSPETIDLIKRQILGIPEVPA